MAEVSMGSPSHPVSTVWPQDVPTPGIVLQFSASSVWGCCAGTHGRAAASSGLTKIPVPHRRRALQGKGCTWERIHCPSCFSFRTAGVSGWQQQDCSSPVHSLLRAHPTLTPSAVAFNVRTWLSRGPWSPGSCQGSDGKGRGLGSRARASHAGARQALHFREKNLHSLENTAQKFNLHSAQWSSLIIYSGR